MSYVTIEDFSNVYVGSVTIPTDEFAALAERASDIIDELTQYRVARYGIITFAEFVQQQIKKACCAQMEHLYFQGIENAVSGGSDGSYSIGSTSITKAVGGSTGQSGASARVSPLAVKLLAPTGLLYRGVNVGC